MNTEPNLTKAQRTRQQIIEASALVFNIKGYAGTSLSDITKATGLTKGSIYGNFKDKNDLALCVFHYNSKRVAEAFRSGFRKAKNSIEILMVFPDTFASIFDSILEGGGCPILNTLLEADDTHIELHHEAKKIVHTIKKTIIHTIENGKRKCEINTDVNAEAIANTLISLIEGAGAMSKTMGDKSYFYHAIRCTKQIIQSIQVNDDRILNNTFNKNEILILS